jgi:hypothetical protein
MITAKLIYVLTSLKGILVFWAAFALQMRAIRIRMESLGNKVKYGEQKIQTSMKKLHFIQWSVKFDVLCPLLLLWTQYPYEDNVKCERYVAFLDENYIPSLHGMNGVWFKRNVSLTRWSKATHYQYNSGHVKTCCILLFGWSPASEFYVPTFRNTLFHANEVDGYGKSKHNCNTWRSLLF